MSCICYVTGSIRDSGHELFRFIQMTSRFFEFLFASPPQAREAEQADMLKSILFQWPWRCKKYPVWWYLQCILRLVPEIHVMICHCHCHCYGGFLSHRGTPSHHPFLFRIFHYNPLLDTPIYGKPMDTPPICVEKSPHVAGGHKKKPSGDTSGDPRQGADGADDDDEARSLKMSKRPAVQEYWW